MTRDTVNARIETNDTDEDLGSKAQKCIKSPRHRTEGAPAPNPSFPMQSTREGNKNQARIYANRGPLDDSSSGILRRKRSNPRAPEDLFSPVHVPGGGSRGVWRRGVSATGRVAKTQAPALCGGQHRQRTPFPVLFSAVREKTPFSLLP